jgi:uncharacterized protein (TIGR02594 family)
MKRFLTAGALASELLLAPHAAEARARNSQQWGAGPNDRAISALMRESRHAQSCNNRTCEANASPFPFGVSGSKLLMLAQSQLGNGAIYGRRTLWCGRFMNWALTRAGFHGTGSDLARSFLALPHTPPQVGAIAVLGRGGRFGHVGIVSGFDPNGNPILISGNHSHRVGRGVYPRRRVIAYVMPM